MTAKEINEGVDRFYESLGLDRSLWEPDAPDTTDRMNLTLAAAIDRAGQSGVIRRAAWGKRKHYRRFIDPANEMGRPVSLRDAVAADWEVWF